MNVDVLAIKETCSRIIGEISVQEVLGQGLRDGYTLLHYVAKRSCYFYLSRAWLIFVLFADRELAGLDVKDAPSKCSICKSADNALFCLFAAMSYWRSLRIDTRRLERRITNIIR